MFKKTFNIDFFLKIVTENVKQVIVEIFCTNYRLIFMAAHLYYYATLTKLEFLATSASSRAFILPLALSYC